jgi:hypothetical protein
VGPRDESIRPFTIFCSAHYRQATLRLLRNLDVKVRSPYQPLLRTLSDSPHLRSQKAPAIQAAVSIRGFRVSAHQTRLVAQVKG